MGENRIKAIEEQIRHHRRMYYNGVPEISDAAFDALEDELRRLAPDSPVLKETGAPPEGSWPKVEHRMDMNSLNKVNDTHGLRNWAQKVEIAAYEDGRFADTDGVPRNGWSWSEKMDGISIALYYERGELVQAVTRGDGKIGEDITRNVLMMYGAVQWLPEKYEDWTGAVRGEIVMRKSHFEEVQEEYANTRNAAAGIARRQSDPEDCGLLTIYAYDIVTFGGKDNKGKVTPATEFDKFNLLEDMGFRIPAFGCGARLDAIENLYEQYADHIRDGLNYDIDGLVVRPNLRPIFDVCGWSSGRPKGAVAIKFANETAITTLKDVKWQVGRSGRITPVAIFEPVELVGASIERASLYNCDYIRELKLWHGDTILVSRANDVIPRVEEVVKKSTSRPVSPPAACPVCSAATEFDGAYLMCPNKSCDAKLPGQISKWLDACGVLGWGDAAIEAICDTMLVKWVPDIYRLPVRDLAPLKYDSGVTIGESRAKAMLDELEDNKTLELAKFIKGLGIPNCGERFARRAIETGLDSLQKLREATVEELRGVPKVGPKKAAAFHSGIRAKAELIDALLTHVTIEEISGPLDGLSFCATGSLSESRKVIYKRIEEAGGTTKSSVSKSLSYLICNDKSATSSKAKKARKYGVPIITEAELQEMM